MAYLHSSYLLFLNLDVLECMDFNNKLCSSVLRNCYFSKVSNRFSGPRRQFDLQTSFFFICSFSSCNTNWL